MKEYKFEAYKEHQHEWFMVKYCDVLDLGYLCKKAVRLGAFRIVIEEVKDKWK